MTSDNNPIGADRDADEKAYQVSTSTLAIQIELAGEHLSSKLSSVREMEIVLQAPIGPQRFSDDTVVRDKDGWYGIITPSIASSACNEILFSNLRAESSDDEIDAVIAEYHKLGLGLIWCVHPWTKPADLGERLLARGATASEIITFIGSSDPLEGDFPGVDIEMIQPEAAESYETFISLLSEGFHLSPQETDSRRRRYFKLMTRSNPGIRLFLARFQGVVAGIISVILKKDSAHMSGVYVRPASQARGVFPSLIAVSKDCVREMGIGLVTGHSNNKSAFWVERFGLKSTYPYTMYQFNPPDQR